MNETYRPYGTQYTAPFGTPHGTPYVTPTSYGTQYASPYVMPFGMSYGTPYSMPYGTPASQQTYGPQNTSDPVPLTDYSYPQNLQQALQLIREATAGETEDRMFYQYLINEAKMAEDKEIIRGIQENEIKHFSMFRQIYSDLTGQILPPPENVTFQQPASYCAGIAKAIRGETNAVISYRKILFAMQNRIHINMLTEIITD